MTSISPRFTCAIRSDQYERACKHPSASQTLDTQPIRVTIDVPSSSAGTSSILSTVHSFLRGRLGESKVGRFLEQVIPQPQAPVIQYYKEVWILDGEHRQTYQALEGYYLTQEAKIRHYQHGEAQEKALQALAARQKNAYYRLTQQTPEDILTDLLREHHIPHGKVFHPTPLEQKLQGFLN